MTKEKILKTAMEQIITKCQFDKDNPALALSIIKEIAINSLNQEPYDEKFIPVDGFK